jgi:peptidoglycan/LPS O-acetylase OafA/YrhL
MQINSLQYGRALAAVSVCAFHLSIMMGVPRYGNDPVFREFTSRGNLGVDFFFVLSGFIICYAHFSQPGQQQFREYIAKRFSRVYPTYWLYTLIFCVLAGMGLGANSTLPSTPEGWLTTISLIRFSSESPPLSTAWTLFHEIAFYIAFGIFIKSRRIGIALFVAWMVFAALNFGYPSEDHRTPFAVYSSAHIFHFVLGAIAFYLHRHVQTSSPAVKFLAFLIFPIVATALNGHPEYNNLQAAFIFSGLIYAITSWEVASKPPPVHWLKSIGESSYTLYLLHLPLQGLALKILMKSPLASGSINRGLAYVLILVGTVIVAHAIYIIVEKPMLKHISIFINNNASFHRKISHA